MVNIDFKGDFGEIEDSQEIGFSVFVPNLLAKYAQYKDIDSFKFLDMWKRNSLRIKKTDIF